MELIRDRVHAIFSTRLNLDVPSVDDDLIQSGLLDSMGIVDLLLAIEQEFGLSLSIETLDLENFQTISSIAIFVKHAKL